MLLRPRSWTINMLDWLSDADLLLFLVDGHKRLRVLVVCSANPDSVSTEHLCLFLNMIPGFSALTLLPYLLSTKQLPAVRREARRGGAEFHQAEFPFCVIWLNSHGETEISYSFCVIDVEIMLAIFHNDKKTTTQIFSEVARVFSERIQLQVVQRSITASSSIPILHKVWAAGVSELHTISPSLPWTLHQAKLGKACLRKCPLSCG